MSPSVSGDPEAQEQPLDQLCISADRTGGWDLYREWTIATLQHIGWTARRGNDLLLQEQAAKPDQFDAFCQFMSVTALEALRSLWGQGQQCGLPVTRRS